MLNRVGYAHRPTNWIGFALYKISEKFLWDGVAVLEKPINELCKLSNYLYNTTSIQGIFPNVWKSGKLKLIQKKKRKGPFSYRPISLLLIIAEIVDKGDQGTVDQGTFFNRIHCTKNEVFH